jgi:transferase CAF17, mitochondrial
VNVTSSFPIFRYQLRSKVEIDNVSEDFACWQQFRQDVVHTEPSTEELEARLIGWGQGTDHAAESVVQGTGHGWQ